MPPDAAAARSDQLEPAAALTYRYAASCADGEALLAEYIAAGTLLSCHGSLSFVTPPLDERFKTKPSPGRERAG